MDTTVLRAFFMWCTIINAGLLIFTFLVYTCTGDLIYRFHCKLYPMSNEAFHVTIYAVIAGYKIIWIVFNLTPYLALSILR